VNAWKLLLIVPVIAALAMVPQGAPTPDDPATVVTLSELQYVNLQGAATSVSARNVVEIRLFEDAPDNLRIELLYENGDYSLVAAQAMHLLRNGTGSREVKLVRGKTARMRFPRLP
jgi:hypothetical protein